MPNHKVHKRGISSANFVRPCFPNKDVFWGGRHLIYEEVLTREVGLGVCIGVVALLLVRDSNYEGHTIFETV